jgi:hypothetical protein
MIDFVRKLKKEVEAEIHRIEAVDANSLKKGSLSCTGNGFQLNKKVYYRIYISG